MAPNTKTGRDPPTKGGITWRPTRIMNMRDLSKDDDFLSHLLVEKLGTGVVPLLVHKMDPSRRLPKTDSNVLLQIVQRNMVTKHPLLQSTRLAVADLLALPPVRYYLKSYTQKQINAFATHASRYFELYHPSGSIEIAHTSRYFHRTGKSELCILATRPLSVGMVISELKGSMANLSEEEDKELKRTDIMNSDIRRDFSVIHSKQMKKNHLFLGPARFVNHDCNNNCELFREGKYITFRVIRPIAVGEEITAHYGDGYFGRNNCHCLCDTCEKAGRGGYSLDQHDVEDHSGSESDTDPSTRATDCEDSDGNKNKPPTNINERRTRRGVYAILQEEDDDSEESDDDETNLLLTEAADVPKDGEIELETEVSSNVVSAPSPVCLLDSIDIRTGVVTYLVPDSPSPQRSSSGSKESSPEGTPFKSIISTRRQKALEASLVGGTDQGNEQLVTPPLTDDAASLADTSSSSTKRLTRSSTSLSTNIRKNDGKSKKTSREQEKVKEEPETRVLRARPSSLPNSTNSSKPPPAKPDIPRGSDGKPLPTCSTCSNILPVISVDSKVVWGLGIECSPKKGKKRRQQDCPRCMRHFAIYAQPWPSRRPIHRTFSLPTPRENTPIDWPAKRVSDKGLPILDRKLAAAASASSSPSRPSKRHKTESREISNTTRIPLGSSQPQNGRVTHDTGVDGEPPKRKRGRPRLSSPRPIVREIVNDEKAMAAQNQPRDPNGRFGKKGYFSRRFRHMGRENGVVTRAQRALQAWLEHKADASEWEDEQEGGDLFSSSSRKRSALNLDDWDRPNKRVRCTDSVFEEGLVPGLALPVKRSPLGLRGMGLLRTPNPMSFARRTWLPLADVSTATSEDETDFPATPEDKFLSSAAVVDGSGNESEGASKGLRDPLPDGDIHSTSSPNLKFHLLVSPPVGALTFKPSPFNFARRRWASTSPEHKLHACNKNSQGRSSLTEHSSTTMAQTQKAPDGGRNQPSKGLWSRNCASSCSGEEDAVIPESLDPSKFVLQRQASFEAAMVSQASNGVPNNSSEMQSAERLLMNCDTPSDLDKDIYPPQTASSKLRKSSTFSLDLDTSPNFVNAGWDSCSDASAES